MKKFGSFYLVWVITAILSLFSIFAQTVRATALSDDRDTPMRRAELIAIGVKTNTIIYAGSMVGIDSTGYAVPASDSSGIRVIGRAQKRVDNRVNAEGAGVSGALTIEAARGTFAWANADTVTDANIGDFAYVVDDQTVSATNAGSQSIIAGVIVDYDGTYVWVDTFHADALAGSFTTLAASGNATVGGTLGVTGAATLSSTLAVTGAATVQGKRVLLAGDAATQLVQSSNVTMHAGTVWTQTFAVAYSAGVVPIVTTSYTEDPGDVRPPYVTSVSSNQFLCTVTADKNFNWIAVGTK